MNTELFEHFVLANCIADFKRDCFDLIYDFLAKKYFQKTIFKSENLLLRGWEVEDLDDWEEFTYKKNMYNIDYETTVIRPDGLTFSGEYYDSEKIAVFLGKEVAKQLKRDPSFSSRIAQLINDKLEAINLGEYKVLIEPYERDYNAFNIRIDHKGRGMPLHSVGAGTRSLISIFGHLSGYELVTLSSKKRGDGRNHDILIIREPENFIHPSLVGTFIEFISDFRSKYNTSVNIVIETHSEIILRKIQLLVKETKLDLQNLAIYYIKKDDEGSNIENINLNIDGSLSSDPPEDFFDINTKLAKDLGANVRKYKIKSFCYRS